MRCDLKQNQEQQNQTERQNDVRAPAERPAAHPTDVAAQQTACLKRNALIVQQRQRSLHIGNIRACLENVIECGERADDHSGQHSLDGACNAVGRLEPENAENHQQNREQIGGRAEKAEHDIAADKVANLTLQLCAIGLAHNIQHQKHGQNQCECEQDKGYELGKFILAAVCCRYSFQIFLSLLGADVGAALALFRRALFGRRLFCRALLGGCGLGALLSGGFDLLRSRLLCCHR